MGVPEIGVKDLKKLRDAKAPVLLLDVREKDEFAHCRIDGSVLIPLSEFQQRFSELPKDKPIVVHCHHGGRSARAAGFLLSQGYKDVKNLAGGIAAWSLEVDSSVPRY